ncbi:MAG: MATE family efflux transporter [Candidatus Binatia bacterium]
MPAKSGKVTTAALRASRPQARAVASARAGTRVDPEGLLAMAPLRAIVRLATPTMVVMCVAATSNVLFTYYVSRLGAEAIAAVSLVFPISLLAIAAMAGGVGAGAASAVARALGAQRRRDAAAVAEHALVLSVGIGLAFALGILAGAPALFRLMGAHGAVLHLAVGFARVLFGGAAITFVGGMFDSVMRGEGNVRVPAIWASTSLVLQIALIPLFMFVAGWGLVGAALAVLASQLLATLARARYVLGGRGVVQPSFWPRAFGFTPLVEILRVGVPASLSTMVNNVGMMVLTGVLAHLGEAHLAAYGLGVRLDFLLLSFAYGFGAAVLTLVGLATGAHRTDRTVAYVKGAGVMMVTLLAVPGLLLWWQPALWFGIFTDDAGIRAVGAHYFRFIGPSYPFIGISMVMGFALQGLGRATAPLMWMAVRVVGVLSAALICTQWLGLADRAVFVAIAAGNVLSAGVMFLLFRRAHRAMRRTAV